MSPVSPLPALLITMVSLWLMKPLSRLFRIQPSSGHVTSIDGLRGFLALFVFLHHSAIWYFFLRTQSWSFPPSYLYNHLGPTSVALFFMITAFLFFNKLIDNRSGVIDWLRLYIGRIMRITPLYIIAILLLLMIVAFLSGFEMKESASSILWEILMWMSFIRPDINGIERTRIIVAGVVWSLLFEWLFYASLVVIGNLIFSIKTTVLTYFICTCFLILFIYLVNTYYADLAWWRLSPFLGGILASFLSKQRAICQMARSPVMSIVILLLFLFMTAFYYTIYEPVPLILMTCCFIAIACGNDLFGILAGTMSRLLGQISYSIYLLHGIFLYITFKFALGFKWASQLSPIQHWLTIAASSVILLVVCCITYKFIELPGINSAGRLTRKIRKIFQPLKNPVNAPFPIHRS